MIAGVLAGGRPLSPSAQPPSGPPALGEYWVGQGGRYAGRITYTDSRVFDLVVADKTLDLVGGIWKTTETVTPSTQSTFDGFANTAAMAAAGLAVHPLADYCSTLSVDGCTDFYLPALDELQLIRNNLIGIAAWASGGAQSMVDYGKYFWTSTELSASSARGLDPASNSISSSWKLFTGALVLRPVRRVAVV